MYFSLFTDGVVVSSLLGDVNVLERGLRFKPTSNSSLGSNWRRGHAYQTGTCPIQHPLDQLGLRHISKLSLKLPKECGLESWKDGSISFEELNTSQPNHDHAVEAPIWCRQVHRKGLVAFVVRSSLKHALSMHPAKREGLNATC